MLDQPILSFKNINSGTSSGDGMNSSHLAGQESAAVPSVTDTENALNNHKFAEVLKQTQAKIDSTDIDKVVTSFEQAIPELIIQDLPQSIDIPLLPVVEGAIDPSVNNESQLTPSMVNIDLTTTVVEEDINSDKHQALLAQNNLPLTEDNLTPVSDGLIGITALKPLEVTNSEARPAPLLPLPINDNKQPLLQTTVPMVEEQLPIITPKLNTGINELVVPATPVQNTLLKTANLEPKLGTVVTESGLNSEEPSFDTELLKSLGLGPQLQTAGQTATASSTSAATNSQLTVTIPFQQAQWGSAVAEKVMWLSSHGIQEAEIQLDPPELGPLQVKVSVENDKANVSFVVQHSHVKEALEQTVARLREMFEAEGIDLVNVDVSDQSEQQQQDEALAEGRADDKDFVDNQHQHEDEALKTSWVQTNNGIDAYV